MWDETTKTCQRNVEEECKWFELCDFDKTSPVKAEVNMRTDVFVTVHNDMCCELAPTTDDICTDPLGAACCKEETRVPDSDVLSWNTGDNKECENAYMVEIKFTFGDGREKHTKTEARTETADRDECCAMCATSDDYCSACFKETTNENTDTIVWDPDTKTCL